MRLIIDIGHPGHVHYFKNFIKLMEVKGHDFLIIARDKEVTFNLLEAYKIKYISRGQGGRGLTGKLKYLIKGDSILFREAKKFNPDIFLSFGSPYAAQVSKLIRKPHIAFDDTEHAVFEHFLYVPFTDTILTPKSFYKNYGEKQIRFNSFMELCSLHPKYFSANTNTLSEIGLHNAEKFILLRFVSWEASHDTGKTGLTTKFKISLVSKLLQYGKVLISSEGKLPFELENYRLNIKPEKIHDLLSFASLYIGEGATTASECAVLGTPAIYVNILDAGTLQEQSKYKLLYNYRNARGVIEKAIELLNIPNLKNIQQFYRKKMLEDKIDVTAFMVWFVENYPESISVMKENPDFQNSFK